MLQELSINNFAIIDELNVSFDEGLTIISGETGAGKSILIGAVSLLLGDRASTEMIRSHQDEAAVEALFHIGENEAVREKLTSLGFPAGDELLIRRVISRTGKNRAQVNGRMATLAQLSLISESLINICGQHQHQLILSAENHIDILDEFGGCLAARKAYEVAYADYQRNCARLASLEELRRRRAEKTELIEFQLREITNLNVQKGEDAALAEEKKLLANTQKLAQWAHRAYALLYGESGCVTEQLKDAISPIKEILKIDQGLQLSVSELEGSYLALQEAALTLRDYAGRLVFDPERLAAVDDRLDAINRLKRKYGGSIDTLLARKTEMARELESAGSVEEEIAQLTKEKELATAALLAGARELSRQRKKAAVLLKNAVDGQIHDLNMPHADFFVEFLQSSFPSGEPFGPKGIDQIEFYLTANVGEEPKPLNKIASGGELSRIVLALKNVLSQTGSVGTVVFDEVDTGIGGATAEIVGRKLKEISAHHQVICITHLPQIASYGRAHLKVTKKVAGGRTATMVESIDESAKVEEIGRMLGGVDVTETAKDHARAMIAAAHAPDKTAGEGGGRNAQKSANR